MFRLYPGYIGMHTQEEAEGAYRNGTRVVKSRSEPGDSNQDGCLATVIGSVRIPDEVGSPEGIVHGYFVSWDSYPDRACFVTDIKLRSSE